MSLASRLLDVVSAIGADIKALRLKSVSIGDIYLDGTGSLSAYELWADGTIYNQADYPDLYAKIADRFDRNPVYRIAQPWRQQYRFNLTDSIGAWGSGTNVPTAVLSSQAVVTKDRVYLISGYTGSRVTTVWTAPINSDGTLGTWTTATALPAACSDSQAVITKNRIYLLGGYDASALTANVYTAAINSDGTLGAWSTAGTLPAAVRNASAVITKSRLYLLGGYGASAPVSTVYAAPINADGTIGAWTTETALPGVLSHSSAIMTSNRVYLFGGKGASSAVVSTVYTAPVGDDGVIGTWTTGTSLPAVLQGSQAVTVGGKVYLLGGQTNDTTDLTTVYYALINSDGTIGTWTAGTALSGSRGLSQAIITNSRIYLLGGRSGGATASVLVATFSGGLNDYTAAGFVPGVDSGQFAVPYVPPINDGLMGLQMKFKIRAKS